MTLYEMTQNTNALYELLQNEEIDEQTFNDTMEAMGTALIFKKGVTIR